MAIAETGMGKTAVFLIPIISHYLEKFTYYPNMISNPKSQQTMSPAAPKVVIVAPTRELAVQIATNARSLAVDTCLLDQIALVYGGASMDDQAESLSRGCVILVATIGRLLDFINRDMVKIDDVEFLVIDESDRQLMDGFEERSVPILMPTKLKVSNFEKNSENFRKSVLKPQKSQSAASFTRFAINT